MADLLTITNSFVNGTNADATQVNQNFTDVKNYIDARLGNLTSGQILVANASGVVTGRTLSGDATISNTGVITIANGAVNAAKIAAGAVGSSELASNAVTNAKVLDGTLNTQKLNMGSAGGVIGQVNGSGNLDPLGVAYTDIPGLSTVISMGAFTNNCYILAIGSVDVEIKANGTGNIADEEVSIQYWLTGLGGAGASAKARVRLRDSGISSAGRFSVACNAGFNLTIGTAWTIKLQAKVEVADGQTDTIIRGATSSLMWVVLGV
jgi:hypothetical protein